MARKTFCDSCEEETATPNEITITRVGSSNPEQTLDLCGVCWPTLASYLRRVRDGRANLRQDKTIRQVEVKA